MAAHFVDVWEQLPHANVKCKGIPFAPSLDWFSFNPNGYAKLVKIKAPIERQASFDALSTEQRERLEGQARNHRNSFIERGYFSAEASRQAALFYLSKQAIRERLTKILSHRFSEVIVDEVQDCSDEDIRVIEFIRDCGIHIVLVGDPDQAIYEFRGRSEEATQSLELLAPGGERLNGNFRSTPAICAVANSFRVSSATDSAVGENAGNQDPILLLKYKRPPTVAEAKARIAEVRGFESTDCIILAHGRRKAASCAGGVALESSSAARLLRIALAVESLQLMESDGAKRRSALRELCVCLQEAVHAAYKNHSTHELYEAVGLTESAYHAKVLRLAHVVKLDRSLPSSKFKESLEAGLHSQGFHWVRPGAIPAQPDDKWVKPLSGAVQLFDYATIHNYKGLQRKFVTVVIPERGKRSYLDTGVGQWLEDIEGEPRRVLYVGVSRAEELLMLAVHESEYEAVHGKLVRDGIRFDVVESGA